MGDGIVHPIKHHIFESNKITWCLFHITDAGGHQLLQRVLTVDGHQLIAQRVIRRMQADRERNRQIITQTIHRRHNT